MLKLLDCGFTPPDQEGNCFLELPQGGKLQKVEMLLIQQKIQPGILDPSGNPAQVGQSIMAQPHALVHGDPERPPKRIAFKIVRVGEPVPPDLHFFESFRLPDASVLAFYSEYVRH